MPYPAPGNTKAGFIMEMISLTVYTAAVYYIVIRLKPDVALCWFSEHVYGIALIATGVVVPEERKMARQEGINRNTAKTQPFPAFFHRKRRRASMPMTFLDESGMDGGVSIPPQSSKPGSTRFPHPCPG